MRAPFISLAVLFFSALGCLPVQVKAEKCQSDNPFVPKACVGLTDDDGRDETVDDPIEGTQPQSPGHCTVSATDADGDCYPDAVERANCATDRAEQAVRDPTIFPGAPDPVDSAQKDSNCDGVDGVRDQQGNGSGAGASSGGGGGAAAASSSSGGGGGGGAAASSSSSSGGGGGGGEAPTVKDCGGSGVTTIIEEEFNVSPSQNGWILEDHVGEGLMQKACSSSGECYLKMQAGHPAEIFDTQVKRLVPIEGNKVYRLCFSIEVAAASEFYLQAMQDDDPWLNAGLDQVIRLNPGMNRVILVFGTFRSDPFTRIAWQIGRDKTLYRLDKVRLERLN